MLPMKVTSYTIDRYENGYVLTLENSKRQTQVRITTGIAVRLAEELRSKIEIDVQRQWDG